MSESNSDTTIDLQELAQRLTLEGMPTQAVVAGEAGVSQSTVSRAMRGSIKGASRGARKLWRYTAERIVLLNQTPVARTAEAPAQLRRRDSQREALNARGEARLRASPLARRRPEPQGSTLEDQDQLAEVAIAGLRDYLADDFDPLLVIEQLAVLRRAQDPARRRRP